MRSMERSPQPNWIGRVRPPRADELAHAQALRRTTVEEHVEVEDLDVVVAHLQRQRAEAAFAAADADHVAVDAEADGLLAEKVPLLATAIGAASWRSGRAAVAIEAGARPVVAVAVARLRRRHVDAQREDE